MKKVRYSNKATTILGVYLAYQQRTGQQMSKQFRVTYETKGVKVVNVWLPESTEIPAQWGSMTLREQDEWLYENQSEAHLNWSDETEGEVVNILPVAELKVVV